MLNYLQRGFKCLFNVKMVQTRGWYCKILGVMNQPIFLMLLVGLSILLKICDPFFIPLSQLSNVLEEVYY
jgi:hypothetical protein